MDKKFTEEEFVCNLEKNLVQIQEPVHHFSDKMQSILRHSENESLELVELKIQLTDLLIDVHEKMVSVQNEILAEYEVESDDNFLA